VRLPESWDSRHLLDSPHNNLLGAHGSGGQGGQEKAKALTFKPGSTASFGGCKNYLRLCFARENEDTLAEAAQFLGKLIESHRADGASTNIFAGDID
jgi:hypothetical protein